MNAIVALARILLGPEVFPSPAVMHARYANPHDCPSYKAYRDPEARKAYMREYMRKRRAKAKP